MTSRQPAPNPTVVHRAAFIVSIYCAAQLIATDQQGKSNEPTDHMVPVDCHVEPAYMQLLAGRLFVSRADYARVLVMPSTDEGEFSIAIYSRHDRGDETALTCTRAEKNLWYSMFQAQQANAHVPPVPVILTDAAFPKSTALAVSKAIEEMIVHSGPPNHSVEVLDGTNITFSIERSGAKPLQALLAPYAHGMRSQSLHELTKLLTDYCDADPADRQNIARQIEEQATKLLQAHKNSDKAR